MKKLDKEKFLENYIRSSKWINNFDESSLKYSNLREPIQIKCLKHDVQEMSVKKFNSNSVHPCPKCLEELKTSEFLEKIKSSKWYSYYDFSKSIFKTRHDPIVATCPEHGNFTTHLGKLFRKNSPPCPKCLDKIKLNGSEMISSDFISMLDNQKTIYYEKSDIDEISKKHLSGNIVIDLRKKIKLNCKIHNESFKLTCNTIVSRINSNKQLCRSCKSEGFTEINFNKWLESSKKIHDNKYSYKKVNYVNSHKKVIITCLEHGDFRVRPYKHSLEAVGCKSCKDSTSSGRSTKESELYEFVQSLDSTTKMSDRDLIYPQELDIINDSKKIAIEFNGVYWHSNEILNNKRYHLDKTLKCIDKGYQLIHVFEDDWDNKKEIVKSRISSLFKSTSNRIYARSCEIIEISSKESNYFLDKNHIQGSCRSLHRYGLVFDDKIVAIMTFGRLRRVTGLNHKEGCFELLRFCNTLNTTVVGGAGKLLKHFIRNHEVKTIISYSDRCWSSGKLYKALGFDKIGESGPSYHYLINGVKQHRYKYRKDRLVSQGFDENLTEKEIMKSRGIKRIFDCGTEKWLMKVVK